ncbi:MAG: hypothetical protein JXB88_26090 [Spirochaetales bacterium]|nr:hypothetical protein [Spirochaetales bacterium]
MKDKDTVMAESSEDKKKVQLTIEEHAKQFNLAAPVFAGVMEQSKWFAGKRITETEFKKAVEAFLNAPQGGNK